MDLARLHTSDSTWELPAMVWRCCTWEAATSILSGTVASCWQVFWHYFAQEAEMPRIRCAAVCAWCCCMPACSAARHAELVEWPPECQACLKCCLITMCQAVPLQHFEAVSLLQQQACSSWPTAVACHTAAGSTPSTACSSLGAPLT